MKAETLVHIFSNFSQFTFFFIYFFIKKVDEKKRFILNTYHGNLQNL